MITIKIKRKTLLVIVLNVVFIAAVALFLVFHFKNQGGVPFNLMSGGLTNVSESDQAGILGKSAILNGDFEQGSLGWSNPTAIQQEESGNHCIINNFSWEVRQDMDLLPHKIYEITVSTKKGTAAGPARVVFTFNDINGAKLPQFYDIKYTHKGDTWEEIPVQYITIPPAAAITRVYLLSSDPKGFHCFDNIKITATGDVVKENKKEAGENSQELIINGNFEMGLYGWIGMATMIQEEENNKFLRNGYNWDVFQIVTAVPGQKYIVTGKARKYSTVKSARIKIVFHDQNDVRIPEFYNILHIPKSDGWEKFTEVIQAPAGANWARIYLLADDPANVGSCDFDDISFKPVSEEDIKNALNSGATDGTRTIHGFQSNTTYVVKSGDTIGSIASSFGVNSQDLIKENNLIDPNRLEIGQILYIPQQTNPQQTNP